MGDKKQKITIQQKPLKFKTEDEVRDDAGRILGFKNSEKAMSGVGQLTSFVKLGFNGKPDRPDGWYLPFDLSEPAIILETKNSDVNLSDEKWIAELDKNVLIVKSKYKKVLGILYNGQDVLVFKDGQLVETKNVLFAKEYYLKLFNQNTIDKQLIYKLTKDINENLHSNFGMKNLIHRMVFTACALVAKRYGAVMVPGMNWGTLHSSILSTLNKSYQEARRQNQKLDLITDCFKEIKSNLTENQQAIDSFIDRVGKISENIDSDYWNGEDVMAIFFNEFTRYKGKSEQGQVFTPDHITSLIYRITGTNYTDKVLDACCGSGAFLVKAMSNMIREVGGVNNEEEVQKIKSEKLFGIEFDKDMFALACANMLIHKDGKTNLDQNDARTLEAGKWIKTKGITKVLMNPPYENKYGCLKIVENVLDNVFSGAICAFILPDTKLEVHKGKIQKWFQRHSLLKIIKLPDIFAGMAGVDTSIFIFKAGEPQNNKPIFACWIKDDGLETVKNQGRHDTKNKWQEIEEFWVNVIYKQSGDDSVQWLKPEEDLCYQVPEEPFKMNEKDFKKTILDFVLFESDIDEKELKKAVLDYVLYESPLEGGELKNIILNVLNSKNQIETSTSEDIDTTNWKSFLVSDIFLTGKKGTPTGRHVKKLTEGATPRISVSGFNNGITGKFADIKGTDYITEENFISFSFLGTCFYHPYKASLDMKVHILKPKKYSLTKYSGLFLVATLKKQLSGHYGLQMSSKVLKSETILLPEKNGAPDWQLMESIGEKFYSKIEGLKRTTF